MLFEKLLKEKKRTRYYVWQGMRGIGTRRIGWMCCPYEFTVRCKAVAHMRKMEQHFPESVFCVVKRMEEIVMMDCADDTHGLRRADRKGSNRRKGKATK